MFQRDGSKQSTGAQVRNSLIATEVSPEQCVYFRYYPFVCRQALQLTLGNYKAIDPSP